MSLVKRGKTWHTHFFVDGQRFRQSLETSDWREAQSKEKDLIADAKAGKLSPTKQEFARLSFREAAERFLQDRIPQLAPLSVRTERERAKVLNKRFGDVQVSRFTTETVLAHVRERKADGIANATINRELDIIRGVLKKAKRWHLVADEIKPLPVREEVGRALSYEGKLKLLKTAALRPEGQNAAWAATLALNTTMRGCEIKQLRWQDIDLMEKALTICKSKTEAGERVIPLNADAWNTVLSLYRRAQGFGEVRPEHYVFPACEASHFDPTRPQTSWRTAWLNITRLIQCPACGQRQGPTETCGNSKCRADIKKVKSPLAGLRFHDLRHHAITELAESQASDRTVMAIAGHVSPKMLEHYSHVRLQAKRTALEPLSTKHAERANSGGETGGYDTNHDTKRDAAQIIPPQVVENMVELVGIEPTTSSLRTMRSPS
jgi:integrase